jgi:hypothetical protein
MDPGNFRPSGVDGIQWASREIRYEGRVKKELGLPIDWVWDPSPATKSQCGTPRYGSSLDSSLPQSKENSGEIGE